MPIWEIRVYRTKRGRYVVENVWDSNGLPEIERRADSFDDGKDVVLWLRDEDGKISRTASRALAAAAATDPGIDAAYGEDVE